MDSNTSNVEMDRHRTTAEAMMKEIYEAEIRGRRIMAVAKVVNLKGTNSTLLPNRTYEVDQNLARWLKTTLGKLSYDLTPKRSSSLINDGINNWRTT